MMNSYARMVPAFSPASGVFFDNPGTSHVEGIFHHLDVLLHQLFVFLSADLIDRFIDGLDHMKRVKDNQGMRQMLYKYLLGLTGS